MYSFLYKVSTGWRLEIRDGFDVSNSVLCACQVYSKKTEAKQAAKSLGASAWNY